jgi:signal transduction histidine kinase/CheY-like chemotaxis protein/HPt (histidine-containing phosphotransfer) domain-containing protein
MKGTSENIDLLIKQGVELIDTDLQQSLEFLENASNLSRETQYIQGLAQCNYYMGLGYLKLNQYKKALTRLHSALDYFGEITNRNGQLNCYRDLGSVYYFLCDYELALENLIEGQKICRELNHHSTLAGILNFIGNIYRDLNEFPKAISHYKSSLSIYEDLEDQKEIANSLFLIGNTYNWSEELEAALAYLVRSLDESEALRDKSLLSKPLASLGILYTKYGKFEKAATYFHRAIEAINETGDLQLKSDVLKSLGNLYIEKGEYNAAIAVLNDALNIAREAEIRITQKMIHHFLSVAYEKCGLFEKSLDHYKHYTTIVTELAKEEIKIKTRGLEIKYDIEEINTQKEIAERSADLKDQFLANVSHEIRTPMNGVLGMVDLLAETKLTPEQQEYVNSIKLTATNLVVVINDILDISKISAGKLDFTETEFDLHTILKQIVNLLRVRAKQKNIKINLKIDHNVPVKVLGDPVRVNQVLMNLLGNSVKFTEKGSVQLEVKLIDQSQGGVKIVFNVIDTGIGIPEDRLFSIFESFTQVSNSRARKFEGAGLGLTITKQLVNLMNGRISVSSQLGLGSTFKVELPFMLPVKESSATKSPIIIEPEAKYNVVELTGVKILLVEDNKVNQFLAKKLLTRMGFEIDIAGDGDTAIEKLHQKEFDLILMDVQMPGMTGYEVTEKIRMCDNPVSSIPIIALTAYASTTEKEKAITSGMNDYITKPYSQQELLSVIKKYLKPKPLSPAVEVTTSPVPARRKRKTPVVNGKIHNHIKTMVNGNKDDMISLIEIFLEQLPLQLAELEEAVNRKDWYRSHQIAHKLKSSISILGVDELRQLVERLHDYSLEDDKIEMIPDLFLKFKTNCCQHQILLNSELIKLKNISKSN